MPTTRDEEGKSSQRIPFIDLDALERRVKIERAPTMAERTFAEPVSFLMGKDDERVMALRKSWAPGWAK